MWGKIIEATIRKTQGCNERRIFGLSSQNYFFFRIFFQKVAFLFVLKIVEKEQIAVILKIIAPNFLAPSRVFIQIQTQPRF